MKKGRNEVLKLGPKGTTWFKRLYGNVIFINIIILQLNNFQRKFVETLNTLEVFRTWCELSLKFLLIKHKEQKTFRVFLKQNEGKTQFAGKQQINCAPTVIIASFLSTLPSNRQDEQQGNKKI